MSNHLSIYIAPTVEPVTVDECKSWLRVDDTTDDAIIDAIIVAARQKAEAYMRRALLTQTLDYTLDSAPIGSYLELPRPPLQSVTSVTYYDTDDVATTMSSTTDYMAQTSSEPGRLMLRTDASWPTSLRSCASFVVRYVAGYSSVAAVPSAIIQGIKIICASLYEYREGQAETRFSASAEASLDVPVLARALLSPYRVLYL